MRKFFIISILFFLPLLPLQVYAQVEVIPDLPEGAAVSSVSVMDASESAMRFDRLDGAASGAAVKLDIVTELVSAQAVRLDALESFGRRNADSYDELADAYLGMVSDQREISGYLQQLRDDVVQIPTAAAVTYDDSVVVGLLRDIRTEAVRMNKYMSLVMAFLIIGSIALVCLVVFRFLFLMLRNGGIM